MRHERATIQRCPDGLFHRWVPRAEPVELRTLKRGKINHYTYLRCEHCDETIDISSHADA